MTVKDYYHELSDNKKALIKVGGVILAILIIAGIIVGVVVGTHKSKKSSFVAETKATQFETLCIAYNVGYKDANSKEAQTNQSIQYVLEMLDNLDFSDSHLTVSLLPYSDDAPAASAVTYNTKAGATAAVQNSAWKLLKTNPSQSQAVQHYYSQFAPHRSRKSASQADAAAEEQKFCLFSPPVDAYAPVEQFKADAAATGILINGNTQRTAAVVVVALNNDTSDYKLAPSPTVIAGTPSDVKNMTGHLNPDVVKTTAASGPTPASSTAAAASTPSTSTPSAPTKATSTPSSSAPTASQPNTTVSSATTPATQGSTVFNTTPTPAPGTTSKASFPTSVTTAASSHQTASGTPATSSAAASSSTPSQSPTSPSTTGPATFPVSSRAPSTFPQTLPPPTTTASSNTPPQLFNLSLVIDMDPFDANATELLKNFVSYVQASVNKLSCFDITRGSSVPQLTTNTSEIIQNCLVENNHETNNPLTAVKGAVSSLKDSDYASILVFSNTFDPRDLRNYQETCLNSSNANVLVVKATNSSNVKLATPSDNILEMTNWNLGIVLHQLNQNQQKVHWKSDFCE